jgi:hypothetical protein
MPACTHRLCAAASFSGSQLKSSRGPGSWRSWRCMVGGQGDYSKDELADREAAAMVEAAQKQVGTWARAGHMGVVWGMAVELVPA